MPAISAISGSNTAHYARASHPGEGQKNGESATVTVKIPDPVAVKVDAVPVTDPAIAGQAVQVEGTAKEGDAAKSVSCLDQVKGTFNYLKSKVISVGTYVEDLANKHMSPNGAQFLLTLLKVKPFALLLLLLPTWAVITAFTIGIAVVIIQPSVALAKPGLSSICAGSIGLYSIMHAVKEALWMGLSSMPQLHLVAVVAHLFVSSICFKFSQNITEEQKKQADKANGKEEVNQPSGLKLLGLGSKPQHQQEALKAAHAKADVAKKKKAKVKPEGKKVPQKEGPKVDKNDNKAASASSSDASSPGSRSPLTTGDDFQHVHSSAEHEQRSPEAVEGTPVRAAAESSNPSTPAESQLATVHHV